MTTTIVVAVGVNGVIGADGGLPWPPTGDLRQFRELTTGHPIVMGRATFDSIGRPLPGRTSVVLTRDPGWAHDGVLVAPSLEEALAAAADLDSEVFLIGGASVYAEARAAGVVDRMVVTHVDAAPDGDAWFDPIDPLEWTLVDSEQHDGYEIASYEKRV